MYWVKGVLTAYGGNTSLARGAGRPRYPAGGKIYKRSKRIEGKKRKEEYSIAGRKRMNKNLREKRAKKGYD